MGSRIFSNLFFPLLQSDEVRYLTKSIDAGAPALKGSSECVV